MATRVGGISLEICASCLVSASTGGVRVRPREGRCKSLFTSLPGRPGSAKQARLSSLMLMLNRQQATVVTRHFQLKFAEISLKMRI